MIEAHAQLKNGNVLKFLKEYWFIVVFIFGVSISWSEMRGSILDLIQDNEVQAEDIKLNATALNTLDKKYIEDVTFIKTTLEELKRTKI